MLIVLSFFIGALPLVYSSPVQDEPATVIAKKTLTRTEPVVCLGSQFTSYVTNMRDVDNIFVWAWRDGDWRQVVFQIDEANGTFLNRAGTGSAGPHKQFYIPDNGWLDNDDEICFMANETGDRVNVPIWAPGANTSIQRYEITVTDPLDTTKKGWVYMFYHDTPPVWTAVDYASWTESTNFVNNYGYSLDYLDSETRQLAFMEMKVKSTIGGTNTDIVDREKKLVRLEVGIDPERCEYGTSTRGLETYYPGVLDDDPTYLNEYGVKDGRVRVLKHIRWGFGSANLFDLSDKMGWRGQVEYKYYSNMYAEDEIISDNSNGAVTRSFYRSIDHSATATPMSYYNSQSGTGTINGDTVGDNVPSATATWSQISSTHGSYVTRYKIGAFSGAPADIQITTRWIDNSAATDTDGTRTGAEPGRYGENGISWYAPTDDTAWNYARSYYYTYFLPANALNAGNIYASYADFPLVTTNPVPALQTWVADHYPPATVTGTVLVAGSSYYNVSLSAAGNVILRATIDDTTTGGSTVASAVWTDGFANFPGSAMTAQDGAFGEINEPVQATLPLASWGAGVHEIYVYGTDQYLNLNETSIEHVTITIIDDRAPSTNTGTVLVDGAATYTVLFSETVPVHLTATVDDTNRGFSDIISAVWTPQFASFPGTPTTAVDGTFDTHVEPVEATLDLPSWNAGVYSIHVYGTDATPLQNTTSTQHATVTIIDDVAPLTGGVLLNGQATLTMGITDDPILQLTATVDDAGRGGTVIAGANYTLGSQNWAASVPMVPVNALDSATEAFTNTIDVTGWVPGTYLFYVYGRDGVPNCDILNAPFAVLIIENEFAPEIKNVLVNGVPEISVPFSARGTMILTATVDDTGHGDNNIAGANYTVGMVNWPTVMPMTPVNALDSASEDFTATVDISTWPVGNHDLYAYGWDESNDGNSTSQLFARIIIYDDTPPNVDTVRINGAEIFETANVGAGTVTVTAWVDDSLTGGSVIAGANYTVGPAAWGTVRTMAAVNTLDTAREQFTAALDLSTWSAGVYYLYAYGWDIVPSYNTVPGAYATLIIHDVMAPTINNVKLNGTSIYSVDYANATSVELTALLDDTGRGDSEIAAANYTLGFRNWASAVPMATYNDEALADVPVAGTVTGDYTDVAQTDDGIFEGITEATASGSSIYNYATGTGTDKWAYVVDSDSAPMENAPNAQTVLTAAQYTQVSASDDSRFTSLDPGYNDYVSIRGALYLGQTPDTISQITLLWEGYVSRAGNVNLYARNQAAGTWTQVASAAASTGGDGTVSGTLTGVTWSDYVTGANNEFIFLVQFMTADPLIGTTTMTTDYIRATVSYSFTGLEHCWRFDMGSNPTFYIEASNPTGSDSTFKFQWSSNGGTAWNDFTTNIQFAAGESALKSSAIAISTYYNTFLVRAVTVNPGAVADTLSVDRMWATGQFNNNPEAVYKVIDISNWQPGEYQLYVYGHDKTPQYNVTSRAYATLIITDNQPPEILNFLVEGGKHITINLSEGFVNLTGTVDDSRTGNADIAWGAYGHENENLSFGEYMTNDTALDSPIETFSALANISGWHAVNNTIFMYGGDAVGMNNETSDENVTINIIDDVAPATQDWSIKLNGLSECWVDPLSVTHVTVTATVSDEGYGYSNLSSANWTNGQANWTDNWMFPSVGGWDNYTKSVTGTINITDWIPGTYYIYVYGEDIWGNARSNILTYAILYLDNNGPAIEGPWAESTLSRATSATTRKNPYIFVSATSFVIAAYGDERPTGRSVVVAAEYFVDTVGANGTGISMKNVGFRFDSPYEGAYATILCGNWTPNMHHTYHIHFLDAMGEWGDWGSVSVMKEGPDFNINLTVGWNLISIPFQMADTSVNNVLASISGIWTVVKWYDPRESSDPWKSYRPGGTANDLFFLDNTMGIWINVNANCTLVISDGIPVITPVTLYAGWNLVGYATLNGTVNAQDAFFGMGVDRIAVFNGTDPSLIRDVDAANLSSIIMTPGQGYWIHVTADVVWTVDW